MKTKELCFVALCSTFIALCSWISISVLSIPFTMQTFGVFLVLKMLGGRLGTKSILVYILMGIVGAPVFAGFVGGIGVILGPTGGYILGFLIQGMIYNLTSKIFYKFRFHDLIVGVIGLCSCYIVGTVWFVVVLSLKGSVMSFGVALSLCVLPYLIPDLVKLLLSIKASNLLKKYKIS